MGVGGVVFTDNPRFAKRVRMYRDWGRQADINRSKNTKWKSLPSDYNPRFIYEKIGYNFQILELQAAMGRVQLRKVNKIKQLRKKNFDFLMDKLSKYPLTLPSPFSADICWFAFPLSVYRGGDRGKLLRFLEKRGIETRPMFSGNILAHPAYRSLDIKRLQLKEADEITRRSFWISLHPSLTKKQLNYLVKAFYDFFTTGHPLRTYKQGL